MREVFEAFPKDRPLGGSVYLVQLKGLEVAGWVDEVLGSKCFG